MVKSIMTGPSNAKNKRILSRKSSLPSRTANVHTNDHQASNPTFADALETSVKPTALFSVFPDGGAVISSACSSK